MKFTPDISIPGAAYRLAAGRILDLCDDQGRFDCQCQYDHADVTHCFDLGGRLTFGPDVDGPLLKSVHFDRAEAVTLDEDGIGLVNDFSEDQLIDFLAR